MAGTGMSIERGMVAGISRRGTRHHHRRHEGDIRPIRDPRRDGPRGESLCLPRQRGNEDMGMGEAGSVTTVTRNGSTTPERGTRSEGDDADWATTMT